MKLQICQFDKQCVCAVQPYHQSRIIDQRDSYSLQLTNLTNKYIDLYYQVMESEEDLENGMNILRTLTDVLADHWLHIKQYVPNVSNYISSLSDAWKHYVINLPPGSPEYKEDILELQLMMLSWQSVFNPPL